MGLFEMRVVPYKYSLSTYGVFDSDISVYWVAWHLASWCKMLVLGAFYKTTADLHGINIEIYQYSSPALMYI